jgi:hypothetical protein
MLNERIDNEGRRLRPWPSNPRYLVREDGVILDSQKRAPVTMSDSRGRLQVALVGSPDGFGGSRSTYRVSVVVCETFHGPKPAPGMHAAHDDGDVRNNSASNLAWKTPVENAADKIRHGRQPMGEGVRHLAKLTEESVRAIREAYAGGQSRRDLAARYRVSVDAVDSVVTRRTWKHVP